MPVSSRPGITKRTRDQKKRKKRKRLCEQLYGTTGVLALLQPPCWLVQWDSSFPTPLVYEQVIVTQPTDFFGHYEVPGCLFPISFFLMFLCAKGHNSYTVLWKWGHQDAMGIWSRFVWSQIAAENGNPYVELKGQVSHGLLGSHGEGHSFADSHHLSDQAQGVNVMGAGSSFSGIWQRYWCSYIILRLGFNPSVGKQTNRIQWFSVRRQSFQHVSIWHRHTLTLVLCGVPVWGFEVWSEVVITILLPPCTVTLHKWRTWSRVKYNHVSCTNEKKKIKWVGWNFLNFKLWWIFHWITFPKN